MRVPVFKGQALDDVRYLRPPTPTGLLPELAPDLQPKIALEETRPRTPTLELDTAAAAGALPPDSMPLSLAGRRHTEEDVPPTPVAGPPSSGRSAAGVPVTPSGDAGPKGLTLTLVSPNVPASPFCYPSQSPGLSAGVPRTPGRDFSFTPTFPDSLPLQRKGSAEGLGERLLYKQPTPGPDHASSAPPSGPPHAPPAPYAADSSVDPTAPKDSPSTSLKRKPGRPKKSQAPAPATALGSKGAEVQSLLPVHPAMRDALLEATPTALSLDFREEWGGVGAGTGGQGFLPLRELENVLLQDAKGAEPEEVLKPARRVRRSWEELLLSMHSPVASPPRPHFHPRLEFEEMTILYDLWNQGIDEEDIRHLQVTYDKMLQQDSGHDWLNDTLWVPHPHILLLSHHWLRQCAVTSVFVQFILIHRVEGLVEKATGQCCPKVPLSWAVTKAI